MKPRNTIIVTMIYLLCYPAFEIAVKTGVCSGVVVHDGGTLCLSSSSFSCCVPSLGNRLNMPLPCLLVVCYPLSDGVYPESVDLIRPSHGWSALRSFPLVRYPAGDTRCPSVGLKATDVSRPGPISFTRVLDNESDLCPFCDPDFYVSVPAFVRQHTGFAPHGMSPRAKKVGKSNSSGRLYQRTPYGITIYIHLRRPRDCLWMCVCGGGCM